MKRLTLLCIVASVTAAQADPQLTSWFTANSGKYARIYTTDAAQTAGTTSTTWSRGAGVQTNPVYADVNEVNYSANWVYIRTSGLASHIMGPWYATAARTNLFINYPSNTATVYRIPRNPTVPATKTKTGGGTIGRFVNGVSFFDNRDAFSYVTATATEVNPGDGIWARNAFPVEGVTFDSPLAHQANNNYHYHVQPIALRYQLGDHVDYNATANSYSESTAPVTQHSPILAWASDGFPIYGPYGYSDPTNAASGVRRMVSGFTIRDGTKGTANLASTGRITLPAWAAAVQNRSATLTAAQYGPAVSTTYPLSRYLEDFDFLGDLGYTQTTGSTVRDFDLDKFNGRICVTPDYPTPHFCYFTTINADGTPAFPYTIGRTFYGSPTGGATTAAVMTADTPLTQQFIGGANTPLTPVTASVSSPNVTLTWSAVEGGTYSVEASLNQSTWTSKAIGLVSTGTSKSNTYATLASTGTEYGRVTRTGLATYDATGQTAATVAQSAVMIYSLPTAYQQWQQAWYGSTTSSDAAPNATPFANGVPNILVFAFMGPSQNPATASVSQLPQVTLASGNYTSSFTQPSGVSGITYGMEWTTTLTEGTWTSIADTGSGQQHVFTISTAGQDRMFVRFRITTP